MSGLIYLLVDTVTGKKYVGQTRRPLWVRWNEHVYKATVLQQGKALNDAIREHGPGAFTQEALESDVPDEKLSERERFWINELNTFKSDQGLNVTAGGDSPISPGVPQPRRGKKRESQNNRTWRPPKPTK